MVSLQDIKSLLMAKLVIGNNGLNSSGNNTFVVNDIINILWSMVIVSLVTNIVENFSIWTDFLLNFLKTYIKKKSPIKSLADKLPQERKSEISFIRIYSSQNDSQQHVTDALIDKITTLNNVKKLKYTDKYTMNSKKTFQVTNDIKCQVCEEQVNENGEIKRIEFKLFSEKLHLESLRKWVEDVYKSDKLEKLNKFGNQKFFFDETIDKSSDGNRRPFLTFDITRFSTNKTLDALCGDHIKLVKRRIDLFENEEWYKRKGVPHTLGMLLHGSPGCGKTSLIKAIANQLGRHVFNIKLTPRTTKRQLHSLFFSDRVRLDNPIEGDFQQNSVIIPVNKRIYVLEDVDCAGAAVLQRKTQNPWNNDNENNFETGSDDFEVKNNDCKDFQNFENLKNFENLQTYVDKQRRESYADERDFARKQIAKEERIDLSFLLNLFDGILETPGRIVIMTTNHPTKLDRALVRPGRMDISIEFSKCSTNMVKSMFYLFFDTEEENDEKYLFDELINEVYTPAEVQSILCDNLYEPTIAYKKLTKKFF